MFSKISPTKALVRIRGKCKNKVKGLLTRIYGEKWKCFLAVKHHNWVN
jgi:hypothetical protein